MYFPGSVKGIKQTTSINSNIKVPIHSWKQRENFLSIFICLYFITMDTLQKHVNVFKKQVKHFKEGLRNIRELSEKLRSEFSNSH